MGKLWLEGQIRSTGLSSDYLCVFFFKAPPSFWLIFHFLWMCSFIFHHHTDASFSNPVKLTLYYYIKYIFYFSNIKTWLIWPFYPFPFKKKTKFSCSFSVFYRKTLWCRRAPTHKLSAFDTQRLMLSAIHPTQRTVRPPPPSHSLTHPPLQEHGFL